MHHLCVTEKETVQEGGGPRDDASGGDAGEDHSTSSSRVSRWALW